MSLLAPGNFDPGLLDRRVSIYVSTPTRDGVGGSIEAWSERVRVWAEKNPQGGGRLFAAEAKNYESTVIYRIRHRDDVTEGMRLVHGDDTFEIVLSREAGRRHWLFLLCRAVNQTTGDNRQALRTIAGAIIRTIAGEPIDAIA